MKVKHIACCSSLLALSAALLVLGSCESVGGYAMRSPAAEGVAAADAAGPPQMGFVADEVWVITRPPSSTQRASLDPSSRHSRSHEEPFEANAMDDPASLVDPCGGIVGIPMDAVEKKYIHVPLQHTDVHAQISGYIGSVSVTQEYYNPYDGKIEALYVFPLPQNAAVNEFIMTIGARKIRGIIREREEAEEIYKQARSQGYVASLLTQERPNIFTQKVANIEPGRRIDVNIRYFHTLKYDDGWYEWVFPMVVGPRFNPPGSADPIRAVSHAGQSDFSRSDSSRSERGTNVPYLAPHERSGHDIALAVDLDAGLEIEEIRCTSHAIESTRLASSMTRITLSPNDTIPNKDFVLRWRIADDHIKTALLTHRDTGEFNGHGHFTLMIYPPAELNELNRAPLELVFVMDCSGSMEGQPIAIAKQAVDRALAQLDSRDSFQIIRFSDRASSFEPRPIDATPENVRAGVRYVRSLDSSGGTMMINGIKAALDYPHDPERQRYVVFLTDGYISNETEILGEMRRRMNGARIFSFGIGSSPNRFLLERMAALGDGVAAYVGLNESAAEVMDRFIARVAHPALTDIAIDFGAMGVRDVFPADTPDLFTGRPVILTGRYSGEGRATVRVTGRAGERAIQIPIDVDLDEAAAQHRGIASVWARAKIAELTNRSFTERNVEIPDMILDVALSYGLMSAYTAFIAVDSSERTQGEFGTTISVPVPVPDGVKYDTTVLD